MFFSPAVDTAPSNGIQNHQQQQQQQQKPIVSDVCGFIIPGCPLIHAWEQVSPTQLTLTLRNETIQNSNANVGSQPTEILIPNLEEISQISLFLLPGAEQKLPPQSALALYYSSKEPYDLWSIIGAVSSSKPSAIFSVNWNLSDGLKVNAVRLGLAIEPLDSIENLEQSKSIEKGQTREDFGIKVAEDLYNFMGSFSQTTSCGEQIVVPPSALDRWMTRFKVKYGRRKHRYTF